MRTYSKLILAALAASALLAVAASGANARNLSVNEKNFELIWNEAKRKLAFTAGGRTVECNVVLLGSFVERTIKKETSITQNNINHGTLESCTGGTATIRTETMPWPGRYRTFTGRLPAIRSIIGGLIRATFRVRESGGLECEAASEVTHPIVGIVGNSAQAPETGLETTGEPVNLAVEPGNGIPLRGEGFLCAFAGEGRFEGVGLLLNLPRTRKLKITLI
jgi:hypothetical protein